jgi:hypothetical protein
MGLAHVGSVQQGTLVEGREARLPFELTPQCATIVAMGGQGVRDLDAQLLDPRGNPVAHDATHESQAALRACVESAGTYTLVIKMSAGQGDFVTAMWSGSAQQGGSPVSALAAVGAGTCESPIELGVGSFAGSTSLGRAEHDGTCGQSRSKELVYRLELTSQKRVVIETQSRFDAVLYLRRDACESQDSDGEIACNDDAGSDAHASRIEAALEPGVYYVFVDGYEDQSGPFSIKVSMSEGIADACRAPRSLTLGSAMNGSNSGGFDLAHASCGGDAKGRDVAYRLEVAQRSRVRVGLHSSEFTPVVHVRSACADEQSELSCADSSGVDDEAAVARVLDPGSYYVFADATDGNAEGHYSLLAEAAPEQGVGVPGDGCADADAIGGSTPSVQGDTFFAKDDVSGRCGGVGAADVVYRVDVPRKARLAASMTQQDGEHVFVLQRTCGDRASELACGASIDKTVNPGSYFLAVDGASADAFGRFNFEFSLTDVAPRELACKSAALLVDGQSISSTTAGLGRRFSTSCGGNVAAQTASDKLYRISVGARAHVHLALSTTGWDGVLALRKSCLEPDGSSAPRTAEVTCNNDFGDERHSVIDTTIDAGTYFVLVAGHISGNEGPFSLDYRVVR